MLKSSLWTWVPPPLSVLSSTIVDNTILHLCIKDAHWRVFHQVFKNFITFRANHLMINQPQLWFFFFFFNYWDWSISQAGKGLSTGGPLHLLVGYEVVLFLPLWEQVPVDHSEKAWNCWKNNEGRNVTSYFKNGYLHSWWFRPCVTDQVKGRGERECAGEKGHAAHTVHSPFTFWTRMISHQLTFQLIYRL